jgi:hypothetical protein
VVAVLVSSTEVVRAQSGWPGAAPTTSVDSKPKADAASKPAAGKVAAAEEAPKALAKAAIVDVKKPAPIVTKADGASPVATESRSALQSITELLTRQTLAIEALLQRLDASESKMTGVQAAVVSSGIAPTHQEPVPPTVVPVASVTSSTPGIAKPVVDAPATAASAAPSAQIAPRPVATRAPSAAGFSRWGDFQQFNLGFRYRVIENNVGVRTNRQGQNRTEFKGRFKVDRAGQYAVNAGVFSGATSVSSWNNTGMGTGDPARDLHVKQLYFAAAPVSGLELQYGGVYVVRGESTEITTYDNDFYLTGQRVTVKRPKQLSFDEISATQAYLGDPKTPSVFDRFQRLDEPNYYQFLVGKKVGKRVGVSADYTAVDGVPTWRSGFALKAPEMTVLDGVRLETYARSEVGPTPFGWALTLDKKVGRASMSGGFTSIDEHYGGLNGDYYHRGDRWFGKATANLFPLLTVTGQYTWALDADYAIANQERFDVVFTYDVLKTFAPAPRR